MAISKQQFRLLIVAEILLGVAATVFTFYWQSPVVEKVQAFADSLEGLLSPDWYVALMGTAILLLIVYVVALIGLILFRNWARWLYVIDMVVAFPVIFYIVPVAVEGPLETMLLTMGEMLSGAIIALMFFSPVSKFFQREASTNYQ
ncbi:hypothetical protein [Allohahella marinimesophila]|uniref:DUF2127 domain-containing protein n=1 Tax=Allohahella marinimesophila TaxID=1054972 RepID=A0ABP7NS65_9GAMM